MSAFGELVSRHQGVALRAAVAALGSPDAGEDAVQDAWLVALERLASFRGDAAFRTWLLTIVWNRARDRRRGLVRWMRRIVSLDGDGAGPVGVGLAPLVPARTASPEDGASARELEAVVRRLVRALPQKLRDPLLLSASGEHSYAEIAAMLQIPEGTVKWRVSEARRQLRMKLERLGL